MCGYRQTFTWCFAQNRGNLYNRRLTTLQQKRKAVTRIYGGYLSHHAVRERVLRAFLVEEARIQRKVRRTNRERKLTKKGRKQKRGATKKTKKRKKNQKV